MHPKNLGAGFVISIQYPNESTIYCINDILVKYKILGYVLSALQVDRCGPDTQGMAILQL